MLLVIYSSLITGSTYAYLYLENNSNGISGSGKCEGINYKGENISASNLVSTTNYLEGAKSTITLSKNKDCTIYTYVNLYLYTNNTTTAPITTVKALKYKIVSSNNVTYAGVVSYMGDTLLATLPLEDKEVTYTIYLYIDSTLSLGNYNDKTYSGYIYASTEQTSTVDKNEDNTKKNLGLQTIDFDYLGSEQQFVVPQTGTYQLETWGAQGGCKDETLGGYGGYSNGRMSLSSEKKIYITVGGKGGSNDSTTNVGGFGGGGYSGNNPGAYSYGGGGASYIITTNSTLADLGSNNLDKVLIVSAGGGGGVPFGLVGHGGDAGGYIGNDGTTQHSSFNNSTYIPKGGTQTSAGYAYGGTAHQGLFGEGIQNNTAGWGGGGGGGLWGGSNGTGTTGSGGSSYIGNSQLTNKVMYCYNCEESTEESTKTISTTNVSETPMSKYAKIGNGYARITIIE